MTDAFLNLVAGDRLEALNVAADRSGRPAHLLEKDAWVVWALATLYGTALGEYLVFKGATSLSKAYGITRRFPDDVDLTYDMRAVMPDLVTDEAGVLLKTRDQERRWSGEVRKRLPGWVKGTVRPIVADAISTESLTASIRAEGDKLFIDYDAVTEGSVHVTPSVMLQFGARSAGEPASRRDIVCDAARFVDDLDFPAARPRVMHAERTFWEKAATIHVSCLQERPRGDRFARHWHDVTRLDAAGVAAAAAADRELAKVVARYKSMYFAENTANRTPVEYGAAVNGGLRLVPIGDGLKALEEDYARMVEDGLLMEDAEPFEVLVARCADIARRVNAAAGAS